MRIDLVAHPIVLLSREDGIRTEVVVSQSTGWPHIAPAGLFCCMDKPEDFRYLLTQYLHSRSFPLPYLTTFHSTAMTEIRKQRLEHDLRGQQEDSLACFQDLDGDEETSFGLSLQASGEAGGYHTANDPKNRFQRATVTDREGSVDVHGKSKVIIHGSMSSESNEAATLLVYDFTFNPTKRFRRIASAVITFEFASNEPDSPGPEVQNVAPSGYWSLAETMQNEHVEKSRNANFGLGYQGVSVGGTRTWTRSIDREVKDSTSISGDTICNAYGKETGAKFVLLENDSASPKTGIPPFFRLAILLKREGNDLFQCTVNIDIEADWRSQFGKFFAAKNEDDPIYFDPELAPVNKLKGWEGMFDAEDLGSTNVEVIFDATMHTMFKKPIKEQT